MSRDALRKVFSDYCDALMGRKELNDKIVAPDMLTHLPEGNSTTGIDGVKKDAESLREAFPDYKITIEDTVVEGVKLSARLIISGTHSGVPYFGVPPEAKGKAFSVGEILIVRIEDGRIAEHWAEADMTTMMRQLGVLS